MDGIFLAEAKDFVRYNRKIRCDDKSQFALCAFISRNCSQNNMLYQWKVEQWLAALKFDF